MKRCLKETLLSHCTSASCHSVPWAAMLLLEFLTFDLRMWLFLRLTMVGRLETQGWPRGLWSPAKMEVQLGLLTGPGEFQAACQVAWLSVIHEVTKVWINIGSIHGCIHNIDGSCSMSQANEKVTCLEEFFSFLFYLSSRESNQPRNGECETEVSRWDTPVALIRGLGSGISSSHCAPNYKEVMTPIFPHHK